MSRAWTKLIDKQVKDLTSTDLMKLTQLMYIDTRAIPEFESLQNLAATSKLVQASGQSVLADSLKFGGQTANASTVNFKPSNLYDGEPFASTYLLQLLAVGATATGGDSAAVSIGLTDGANSIILQKTTTVTASGPLTYVPPGNPIYLNELNYLSINNAASVNSHITVYCAIVARGGAQ